MKKSIHSLAKEKIVSGEFLVFDSDGNELDVVVDSKSTRSISLYHTFMKMSLLTDEATKDLSLAEKGGLVTMVMSINKNNVVDFTQIEDQMGATSFFTLRAKLRRLGFVDKLKLDKISKWYANPYFFAKSKTCDARLADHFKNKIKL